jgi:hypothetical protein
VLDGSDFLLPRSGYSWEQPACYAGHSIASPTLQSSSVMRGLGLSYGGEGMESLRSTPLYPYHPFSDMPISEPVYANSTAFHVNETRFEWSGQQHLLQDFEIPDGSFNGFNGSDAHTESVRNLSAPELYVPE